MATYIGVFAAAFLAATIVPFYSELAVGAAVVSGSDPFAVWAFASAGNTLGAIANGLIGRLLGLLHAERILRIRPERFARVQAWFQKWGVWSLLFAWLPVVGDALTVVAGALRVPWSIFVSLVFVGKAARYAVVILVTVAGMQT